MTLVKEKRLLKYRGACFAPQSVEGGEDGERRELDY